MSILGERWVRIALLILVGIAIIVLPRFLPDVSLEGLSDSDKFGIQLLCFVAVSALIALELLTAAFQCTRAILRGEASIASYMAATTCVLIVLALFVWETRYSASVLIESVVTLYVLAVGYLIIQGITRFMAGSTRDVRR